MTLAATAEAARLAYAEQTFPVVVVDHELSDDSGLDLLDAPNACARCVASPCC